MAGGGDPFYLKFGQPAPLQRNRRFLLDIRLLDLSSSICHLLVLQ